MYHTKRIVGVFVLLGILWIAGIDGLNTLASIPAAHAQANPLMNDAMRANIQSVLGFLIELFNVLAWLLFALLNFLLDPVIIFNMDAGGGLEELLNTIWRLSRDLTNLAFAIALIGVAIYTVVTANKEIVMQHAAKFVMALVLVNFSWFIPRVVLDVANIATATVYGLPSLVGNNECKYSTGNPPPAFEQCVPDGPNNNLCTCSGITDIRFFPEAAWIRDNQGPPPNGYDCSLKLVCYKRQTLDANAVAGHSAILNGLIINHARLKNISIVPPRPGGADNLLTVIVRSALVLLIEMALVFPLAAMAVVFFIRIPVLWLTIAFMPFVLIGWVIDDQYTQGVPKKIMDNFVKAAFVPAVVAVPLAVGYMLINAGAQQVNLAGGDVLGNLINIPAPLIAGVDSLWQVLWLLMSLMVMYVGVFSAIQAMQFEGGIGEFQGRQIQRIQDTGQAVAGIAQQSIRLLPTGMPSGMNVGQLLGGLAPRNIQERIRQMGTRQQGSPGPALSITQQTDAASTAAAARREGAAVTQVQLRELVRRAGGGGAADLTRLRDALHQLNPNLRAQTLNGEQLIAVLRHMESGNHLNRLQLDIETHAAGIRQGAGGAPAAAPNPPPAPPGAPNPPAAR